MIKTTAAVVRRFGAAFEVVELDLDGPRPDEVLVALDFTGICHTDLSVRDGKMPIQAPAVLGHEGVGVVEAIGANITDIQVGERVVLTTDSCGTCVNCQQSRPFACMNFFAYNFTGTRLDGSTAYLDGNTPIHSHCFGQSSFSDRVSVRRNAVIPVTADMPPHLMAPLGCGVLTGAGTVLNVQRPGPNDPVAIFGSGTVGLSAVMAAAIQGCETIIVIDPVPGRRALALGLGATHAIDPRANDPLSEIASITGSGVRYSIEASGIPAVLEQAIACLAPGGDCAILGAPPAGSTITLDIQGLINVHHSLSGIALGGSAARDFIPQLVEHWAEGRLPLEKLVTVYDFADINTAVAATERGEVVKPVLRH